MGEAMRNLSGLSRDLAVTLLLWLYFTLGFILFFLPFYIGTFLFQASPEAAFQRLNHYFYRGFFRWLGLLVPGLEIRIDPALQGLRGAVVVSDHHSYLDPLLFQSVFARQTTIVKSSFFRVPVFGWFIKTAGYMPASAEGPFGDLMLRRMDSLRDFFADGGVMFVFPEGTRRPGRPVGALHQGAFKIAHRCRVPLAVTRIRNTAKIFPPGHFLFRTTRAVTVDVALVAVFNDDAEGEALKAGALKERVEALLTKPVR
jgi:1-acyl-sn-glycerol-3-phosphate acyltransferase